MTQHAPAGEIDSRFSDPSATPTPWDETARTLERAQLYWLTSVRADGRPHVTPLVGVVSDGAVHFCTGLREQKARNLDHNAHVALTTGNNAWDRGLDVVVEGTATRITDPAALQRLADTYEVKYGSAWHFDVTEGGFTGQGDVAAVFRVEPAKVFAFAKEPHGQTRYRFGDA
ncbi:pyridoxamine 5'-phosphate oxidase family protein [Conexibacter sp. CPCC 206217]|uniref:pyridoxamine 5'-phosphate oxidase family protein n=1 Tax=Conexibacter sp. CPCC 206217 TaxID=3064574 RepID=UPI0027206802|nr:pyridoxamine 5'-phosphate oxidase family protein [Conexibacter sp. CPCC 206217]MDO8213487.1 pyridoxamine 5'-phosphate oxidase family protein [Conexibacter sp. CPCC 206217]